MESVSATKKAYAKLIQPSWAPPAWVFGPVWSVLYCIIIGTYGYVVFETYLGHIPVSVLLVFVVNLVANVFYTPLQFGLRNLILATADILLVFASLIAAVVLVYSYAPFVSLLNIPYLIWVGFATVLQITITILNNGVFPKA